MKYPRIFAHRGASAYAPENTIAAMQCAAEKLCSAVEFDVRLTRCGEVVVFHDNDLLRLCNKNALVKDYTYAELKNFSIQCDHPQFPSAHIVSLSEMLVCLKQLNLQANIELKPDIGDEQQLAEKVIHCVNDYWPANLTAPIFSSFSFLSLEKICAISPQSRIALLLRRWRKDCLQLLTDYNAQALHINYRSLNLPRVKLIKSHGYNLAAYTVNKTRVMEKLFAWGVDSIFSDYPDLDRLNSKRAV